MQLVSQYLTLKKAGADRMVGLCPFHQEKTPSFGISPSKQLYYCHGCGAGGDAIRFIRELEHLSYVEAVERLAQQAGRVPAVRGRFPRGASVPRPARPRCIARTSRRPSSSAACSPRARKPPTRASTSQARGISPESIQAVRCGVRAAASATSCCASSAGSRDLSPEILLEAGLATRGDDGQVRDRFRGRVTFPIHDLQGRGIGFGARILPTDPRAGEQAKYLNTAETPIYKKHEVLYNLHRARQSVAKTGEVFVVEGYTDVIGLVQAGIENAVATCGTALGEGHFRQLARFTQRAVLAFDSDEAGARAAERAFAFQQQFPSVQALVMIIPQGLDPADFVAKHGADAVREAAKGARPLVEYMVRRTIERHDLSSVEGQSTAVDEALPGARPAHRPGPPQRIRPPGRRSHRGHRVLGPPGAGEPRAWPSGRGRRWSRPSACRLATNSSARC